jgi:uncharacterized protein YeeX (DUF496 family)
MDDKDLQKIIVALQDTIDKKVNGKIIRLDEKLDAYIKHDMEWKETVQPVIDAYDTVNRVGGFVQWFSKVILAIGVIVATIFYTQK